MYKKNIKIVKEYWANSIISGIDIYVEAFDM